MLPNATKALLTVSGLGAACFLALQVPIALHQVQPSTDVQNHAGNKPVHWEERLSPADISRTSASLLPNNQSGAVANAAIPNEVTSGGLSVLAQVFTSGGWVKPGESFPVIVTYKTGSAPVAAATIKVALHSAAVFNKATPMAASGSGSATSPLIFAVGPLAANSTAKIIIEARAKDLIEDPEALWKDVSSTVTVEVPTQTAETIFTHGPKITDRTTARYGDRPFPVVLVQYQDITRCTAAGMRGNTPDDSCLGDSTAQRMDVAINSRTTGTSLWQLFQDMSFGQLYPIGKVSPIPNAGTKAFTPGYVHKFSSLQPAGTCTGNTVAAGVGTALYSNRIVNGWYSLPGTQNYYGADKFGHNLGASVAGQGAIGGIDDACGPTGKIIYDAASLADPDIDYNDFDTDKDGVVDFFNLMFAGDGGNGSTTATGLNNIWPHKSDARFYFTDANGLTGYVSNDQLKDHFDRPVYYTDAKRLTFTTTVTAFPVFVRVGPYNVNPEPSIDHVSVVAHEYGHSLQLPDFYSLGSRSTFGSWELMGSDHFQYMTGYSRSRLGWVVPQPMPSGNVTMKESKFDTGEIKWTRADGTPYTLTGAGIHNADTYRLGLPTVKLINQVPSGVRAWFSGAGNDFGCAPEAGHNLDFFIPEMGQTGSAAAVTLKFKSLYEIEWDFDYAFVLVSTDAGATWTSVASKKNRTIANSYNPNQNGCFAKYNNGITGTSGSGDNNVANLDRAQSAYPAAKFIDDEYDLTPFKGKDITLRFSYSTDPGLAKRGWFIDDINIMADTKVVYADDFETRNERRIFPFKWNWASTADGVDTEKAFYVELRDRTGNDFDGKGQSERSSPGWQPGVSMILTDEFRGFGNTGVDSPPAQTPVDAAPQPGNESPNLDDASFTLVRPTFNGCVHIDNYADPSGPNAQWKLPKNLKFSVNSISGMSTDGKLTATPPLAGMTIEVNPNCDLVVKAPTLAIGSGYENPDTDGSYQLTWDRPTGAAGPETLQEATICQTLLDDNAENGLTLWDTSTMGTGGFAWQASGTKRKSGANAFWGRTAEAATDAAALLTTKQAYAIPLEGDSNITFWDFSVNEGDDTSVVEASTDNGAKWTTLNASSRSALAPDAAVALQSEAMVFNSFSLNAFKGKSVKIRFRQQGGPENRAGSTPLGWYVDDIKIETSNFTDVATNTGLAATRSNRPKGTYCYRVKTRYPAGPVTIDSPWSNVVKLVVNNTVAVPNRPPVAAVTAMPTSGTSPLTVQFDASGSTDPDGDPLTYTFDYGDGTQPTTSSVATPSHQFTQVGTYTVRVTATDSVGAQSVLSAQVIINVTAGSTDPVPPTPTVVVPDPVKPVVKPSVGRFGGGSLDWLLLTGLVLLASRRRK
jgi:M6 family metalloprotease-like protein